MQRLDDCIGARPENKGLLTVSNHTSCMDDPLMWGKYILPARDTYIIKIN
jgi:hypothetical protein